jgi:23S rRNA G2069 N7-methylase RlmK/C1962 C5-methylase RlmI
MSVTARQCGALYAEKIIQHLSGGADHPVALSFPEGDYLKGLLLQRS